MNGLIVKFVQHKSYGYIQPLVGGGPDTPMVFFHALSVAGFSTGKAGIPPEGCEVSFSLVRGTDGTVQAADVHIVPLNGNALKEAKRPSVTGHPRDFSTREKRAAQPIPHGTQPGREQAI